MSDVSSLTVADVMSRDVLTLTKDVPASFAYELMKRNRIGSIPVVDSGTLVGIIALSDFKNQKRDRIRTAKLGDVMARNVVVAHPDEKLDAALARMTGHMIGRLPVVNRSDKKLVGIVTHKGIAEWIAQARSGQPVGERLVRCPNCNAPFKEYARTEKCAYCRSVITKW
jgi:CBS domain-containing protein